MKWAKIRFTGLFDLLRHRVDTLKAQVRRGYRGEGESASIFRETLTASQINQVLDGTAKSNLTAWWLNEIEVLFSLSLSLLSFLLPSFLFSLDSHTLANISQCFTVSVDVWNSHIFAVPLQQTNVDSFLVSIGYERAIDDDYINTPPTDIMRVREILSIF